MRARARARGPRRRAGCGALRLAYRTTEGRRRNPPRRSNWWCRPSRRSRLGGWRQRRCCPSSPGGSCGTGGPGSSGRDRLAVVVLLDQARVRESAALVAVVELVVVARHRNLRAVLSDRRRPSTLLVSEAATLGSTIFGTSSQAHAPEGSPEPLPIRWMAAWAAARGQQHVDHAMVADGLDDSAAWLPAARAGWVDEGDRDSGAGLASPL